MTKGFRLSLICVVGSLVSLVVGLQMTRASYDGDQYLPVGHDSFFHARRILDTVRTGNFYQFDAKMHAPEGDWIAWPWGYDYVVALAVRAISFVTGITDSMAVLVHLPLVLGTVGVGLTLAVCVLLGLSEAWIAVGVACFALHAFTQFNFGVGALDHHGVEQLWTLGVLALGLRWFQRPESMKRAVALGGVLGLGVGVHPGLLILQVPVVVAALVVWLRGERMPARATAGLSIGLLVATGLVLLPAATFWQGRFELNYLSWLHLYVAGASAIVLTMISRRSCDRHGVLLVLATAVVLAVPLIAALRFSAGFAAGDLAAIARIDEIRSPFDIAGDDFGVARIGQMYTHLVWLAPLTLLLSLGMVAREADRALIFFWVTSSFGLVLLMLQVRLGVFGVAFLYLPILVIAHRALQMWPQRSPALAGLVVVLLAIAYLPTVQRQLFGHKVVAMDQGYSSARVMLPTLAKACHESPGIVLADPSDGHLIRYFTDCAVIANNFRLTRLDVAKVDEALSLIGMPVDGMRERAPFVKYVLARLIPPAESLDPVLFAELLDEKATARQGITPLAVASLKTTDGATRNFFGVFRVDAPGDSQVAHRSDRIPGAQP